jgi:hypothetical protein
MKAIERFANWIVFSSKDSRKISLSVKAGLTGVITVLAILNFDTSSMPEIVDMTAKVVEQALLLVSAVATLYGFIRKVKLTRLGENDVLNNPML